MIDYSQPQTLQAAVDSVSARTPLGTALRSAEIERLPRDIKQRAFFSAGMEHIRMAEKLKAAIMLRVKRERRIGGEGTFQRRGQFIVEMQALAERYGIRPTDERRGGLQDIGSFRRLRLIWDTQVAMAQNYTKWKMGMDEDVLFSVPAQELVRISKRQAPRDWQARWLEAMGTTRGTTAVLTDDGRMYALKTDPIWVAISRFENPYPPFDFNSGMGVRNVRRRKAIALGLMKADDVIKPSEADFDSLTISARGLDAARVKSYFGDMVEVDHGSPHKPAKWRGDKLESLIERAQQEQEIVSPTTLEIGRVNKRLAERAREVAPIDDYVMSLTDADVFRIFKSRGLSGGTQRPVLADDFYNLLTHWRRPVAVRPGATADVLELIYEHRGERVSVMVLKDAAQKALRLAGIFIERIGG